MKKILVIGNHDPLTTHQQVQVVATLTREILNREDGKAPLVYVACLPETGPDRELVSISARTYFAESVKQVPSSTSPKQVINLARECDAVIACPKRSRNMHVRAVVWSVIRDAKRRGTSTFVEIVYPTPK